MAKFTVTVPFPYSARVGGSGTNPATITVEADNPNAAAVKLVGFGIPFAAASGFGFTPIVDAPPSLSEQAGFTTPAGTGNVLGKDITADTITADRLKRERLSDETAFNRPPAVAGGTVGQGGLGSGTPTTTFGSTVADRPGTEGFSLAGTIGRLFSDPRGTTTPAGGEEGFTNNSVIDPISIRLALQNLKNNNFDPRAGLSGTVDPATISNLAATTGSGIIPPPSDFNPASISNLAATTTAAPPSVSNLDSQEAARFAANERERLANLRRQVTNATNSSTPDFVGDPSASAGAGNVTGTVPTLSSDFGTAANGEIPLPTGVIEPLGKQSDDLEAGIATMLAQDGSLTRKEALALWKERRNGAAGKSGEDAGGGGVAFPLTPEQQALKDAAEAKAAIDAGISADANLTLAPDTLEFQRAQFLQGLRNRGLGNSGVAGQARRDAFGQANTRNIFNNVFNRGEDDQVGLSDFVGNANNALMGAGARAQAQNQFQQALDLSRGFNPAGTGFDTQGLTTLQQDILNPQGAGQAGLLNDLAMQTARKKFGVGAEFLGRRNFADEFFGQDRGTAGTFAEHLNKRLFGGRF